MIFSRGSRELVAAFLTVSSIGGAAKLNRSMVV